MLDIHFDEKTVGKGFFGDVLKQDKKYIHSSLYKLYNLKFNRNTYPPSTYILMKRQLDRFFLEMS